MTPRLVPAQVDGSHRQLRRRAQQDAHQALPQTQPTPHHGPPRGPPTDPILAPDRLSSRTTGSGRCRDLSLKSGRVSLRSPESRSLRRRSVGSCLHDHASHSRTGTLCIRRSRAAGRPPRPSAPRARSRTLPGWLAAVLTGEQTGVLPSTWEAMQMTQQYLAGELSLLLARLPAVATNPGSLQAGLHLRHVVETVPLAPLPLVLMRAIELVERCAGSRCSGETRRRSITRPRSARSCTSSASAPDCLRTVGPRGLVAREGTSATLVT